MPSDVALACSNGPGSTHGTNSPLVRYGPPSRPPAFALSRSLGPCGPRFLRLASDRRLVGLGGIVLNLPSGAH